MIRKTKIIATIGPSTSSRQMLRALIQKWVNVCRLNLSHLSHEKAKEALEECGGEPAEAIIKLMGG